jgi:digeranylgeranylglycerophospholipid reductase
MRVGIIGAGISGLYLGWKLSEKGHSVKIFERKSEIGNSACSGLFSARILDFIPESKNLIKNRINYTLINFPQKTVRVDFQKEFFVMNHAELDKMIAEKIKDKIILNKNIKEIPLGFDKVIGADGPNSIIRKALSLPEAKYRLGILGIVRGSSSYNFVETWPVNKGFIWKIPRGDTLEYGILAPQHSAKKLLFEFLAKNNIVLNGIRAKIVPQGFILPESDSVTLAGDAAGLTKPWSGGGVIWQLTLADILLNNFPDFKRYKKEAYSRLKPKIASGKINNMAVHFLGFNMPFFLPKNNKIESDFL